MVNLRQSLLKLNIDHDIVAINNLGSWQRNTQYKPVFIRQMLDKHNPRPIVCLDADHGQKTTRFV